MTDLGVEDSEEPVVVAIDDEPDVLTVVQRLLGRQGFETLTFEAVEQALDEVRTNPRVALIVTDLHMPERTGLDVLRQARTNWPSVPVIVMTGRATISSAVEAIRQGAYDYIVKPLDPPEILGTAVQRALDYRRLWSRNRFLERQLKTAERFAGITASSEPMLRVLEFVDAVAGTDSSVLVLGETGTGKELVARAIHERSQRAAKPFVAVNCGALAETLLESELFGHAKGAFTGAMASRQGLFEEASGGTLFLDEVAELAAATQVKLLRVLQEGEIRPVGATGTRQVDVRIIAATHRDIERAVAEERFRQDLYYRINVVQIRIPPLKERRDDIPSLAKHFVDKHAERTGRTIKRIEPSALDRLVSHEWPGNVRELENVIQRALIFAAGETLAIDDVRLDAAESGPPGGETKRLVKFADARANFERGYLKRAMELGEGKQATAARLSGLDPSNLRRMLKRHGIEPD